MQLKCFCSRLSSHLRINGSGRPWNGVLDSLVLVCRYFGIVSTLHKCHLKLKPPDCLVRTRCSQAIQDAVWRGHQNRPSNKLQNRILLGREIIASLKQRLEILENKWTGFAL